MLLYLRGNYMRIIFVRHGEPDYANDCLTEKGVRETKLLGEYLKNYDLGTVCVSPLGRARQTAEIAAEQYGYQLTTAWWLEEILKIVDMTMFPELEYAYRNSRLESPGQYFIPWDIMPGYLNQHHEYMDPIDWRQTAIAKAGNLAEIYDRRIAGMDDFLAKHGYVRNGNIYTTEQGNHDTLTFFCHFGISSLLISHLINVSPFALWHGFSVNTSAITEIMTEEREKGVVSFRINRMGDISHLANTGEEPSFNARFCEVFEDSTRH